MIANIGCPNERAIRLVCDKVLNYGHYNDTGIDGSDAVFDGANGGNIGIGLGTGKY